MKKLLSILALALAFVACQNEPNVGDKNSDLANVVLNIEAPELATRADGDADAGKNSAFGAIDFFNDADWANYDVRYILEVYAANDEGTGEPIYRERLVNYLDKYAPTQFELRLVPNREYKFVVFADFVEQGSKDDLYYDTTDLRNITAKTGVEGWNAMNEVRDAYFVSENVEISTSGTKTLTLKRPFGKIRVIATDLDYIAGYSNPGYVEVTYHTEALYKSFNAVNGDLNETQLAGTELAYAYEVKKDAPYTKGYDAEAKNQTLFADYLFAREGQQIPVNFKMAVYETKGGRLIKETDFNTQIPVQRNYLTTITGDILTTQANINILINDKFDGEMLNPSMESIAAPVVTATVEGNAVTLAWEAVEGAAKYFTRLAAAGNSAEETTELTKVYENLDWETEYTFEVYAVNEKGLVSETTEVKATTDKKPEFKPEASEWGVVGDLTSWGNDIVMYTTPTENLFVAEKVKINSGAFKIRANKEWNDAKNYGFEVAGKAYADKYYAVITGSGSQNMTPIEYGTYDIYFDLNAKRVALMTPGKAYAEAEDGGDPVVVVEGLKEHAWGLIGSFAGSDWANDVVMTVNGDWAVAKNVTIAKNNEFKFRADKDWALSYGSACDVVADKTYNTYNNGGNMKFIGETGAYDIYFSLVSAKFYMTVAGAEAPAEPVALATPVVEAKVEGNVVTLTWEAIENAAKYGITVGTEMPVFVEETTYVFTGEYETEYTFSVVAVPENEEKFAVSEPATAKATTEAAPAVGPTYTTVSEFLAAEVDDTTFYTLKGTITRVANTSYGNFDLTDETGTIYVYGLYSEDGVTSKYWAASGAKLGDDIVISAKRAEYNGSAQAGSARFMGLTSPGTLAFWTFSKTATTFTSVGGEQVIDVEAYNLTDAITVDSDNAQFSAKYADGALTITATENTTTETINGNITVTAGALKQVITVAQGGASVGGGTEVVAEATMKDFGWANSAAVTEAKIDDNVTVKFFQGGASTAPAYYTSGEAVRLYQNGAYMTVSANGKTIKSMEITFGSNMYYVAADSGELTEEAATRTWTGDATEVKITCTGTDKNHRAYIAAIKVTYIE